MRQNYATMLEALLEDLLLVACAKMHKVDTAAQRATDERGCSSLTSLTFLSFLFCTSIQTSPLLPNFGSLKDAGSLSYSSSCTSQYAGQRTVSEGVR